MNILYFFESIRSPLLDSFFLFITKFGEELIFMLTALIVFWCVDKYNGYYILSIGFLGTVINQFLKITFRIARPWVADPKFKPVTAAIPEATGYSFPSGHTQSAVTTFGGIAMFSKNFWIKTLSIIIALLVCVSRMYLGVHTPLDVGVSIIIGVVLVALYPVFKKANKNHKYMWFLILAMLIISLANLLYVNLYHFPANIDAENLNHAIENAYKLFGAVLGIIVVYFVDNKYTNFNTKAPILGQILKVLFGLVLVLIVKEGIKILFKELGIVNPLMLQTFRYFLLVIMAGCIWPLTFKFFEKLGKK